MTYDVTARGIEMHSPLSSGMIYGGSLMIFAIALFVLPSGRMAHSNGKKPHHTWGAMLLAMVGASTLLAYGAYSVHRDAVTYQSRAVVMVSSFFICASLAGAYFAVEYAKSLKHDDIKKAMALASITGSAKILIMVSFLFTFSGKSEDAETIGYCAVALQILSSILDGAHNYHGFHNKDEMRRYANLASHAMQLGAVVLLATFLATKTAIQSVI